ncbi:hypothetical protein GOP47_0006602 [Adiantum capillus-veneris]|uniref:Uncharacterized protein n=1 Tax=Adiantum capillus-veneris TaxID=13818 RepID=A0A9D4V373_ADICA|nr:hypothetical protein GOP47_0006602 [Adiantum capillus-veneris]
MAGLLAWAADVVTGNGQQKQEEEEEQEAPWRGIRLRLGTEEQEEVRQLEERAAALHQTIQHLRLRIPPPDISRSLPQLHADSLAAHSALTSELNAHQMTQKESETREASLRVENAAYAKAIAAVQGQLQGKRQERSLLNARIQEMENEESGMRVVLDRLPRSLAKKDGVVLEGTVKENPPILSSSDKSLKEGEELQRTRAELRMWENKVARLEQEWLNLLQNSTRYPSAAQCEKELERRLRILSEQLVAKQGQSDALAEERNTLQLRLSQVSEIHRQGFVKDIQGNSYKAKTGKILPAVLPQESKSFFHAAILETDGPLLAAVKRVMRCLFEILSNVMAPECSTYHYSYHYRIYYISYCLGSASSSRVEVIPFSWLGYYEDSQ